MSGVISGGWEFVWAAYAISFTVLAAYGIRLAIAVRRAEKEGDER
ncbi:MAG TPA: hypothetical protein VKY51_02805 [Fredinandcohnia sp.]|nr:hypothetical protein [Fredinandcohnia sp.]